MTTERDTDPGLSEPEQTVPGHERGTASPREPPPDEPGAAERQRHAGESSERSAGTREAEIREETKEPPEEQQP